MHPIATAAHRFAVTLGIAVCCLFPSVGNSWAFSCSDRLVTYPAPAGAALNGDFSVKVRQPGGAWQPLATYLVKVDSVGVHGHTAEKASMASFDFAGKVEVSITSNRGDVRCARVRPLSYGIKPAIMGRTVTFALTHPQNLSVEVNGDIFHNLHLFTNSPEVSRPKPGDAGVIYFGPGIHEFPKHVLRVPSHSTVYLAGGAVLRGSIQLEKAEDVRIIGRGMTEQFPIRISNSKQVKVSGIFASQLFIGGSKDVQICKVKCISHNGWGDGMDVICSADVVIDGVFNRNSDDCIAVYAKRGDYCGGSRRITVKNSTLWADVAHPILVGTHGNTKVPESIEQLQFRNLDILDQMEPQIDYQGCMSLNAGDSNLIRNIRFENIRVEDFRLGQLVNLRVFYNRKYCNSPGRGIENVLFKNVTYTGSHANLSIIAGYDDTREIKDVVFDNLSINGVHITDSMPKLHWYRTSDLAGFFVGEHVKGLKFR